MKPKTINQYKLMISHCFYFNYAGRVAVRIQPYSNRFKLVVRGAHIDYENLLCFYLKGHTQEYKFENLINAINLFNATIAIIIQCQKDTFNSDSFNYESMLNDFDLDLMESVL